MLKNQIKVLKYTIYLLKSPVFMRSKDIEGIYNRLLSSTDLPSLYTNPIVNKPFEREGTRPNSVYVGGTLFGDEGKGAITAEINRLFIKKLGIVYSLRLNGGSNAGHEVEIDGRPFLSNQLPVAVAQEGAYAIITRGTVFNPRDAVMEIKRTEDRFGGEMPGTLWIDERTPLCLDTHRVLDSANGSTGRGIGPAYGDFYVRAELVLKDLFRPDWHKVFGQHYDQKEAIIAGLKRKDMIERGYRSVGDFPVKRLDNSISTLGSRQDFLEHLAEDQKVLGAYVRSDIPDMLDKIWANSKIPVTFEEAQGPGLDPFFGIRPDVTSSRPTVRNVHDGTYGVVFAEDIACKLGVTKPYASSVGVRKLPGMMPAEEAAFYQKNFGEVGKTTGRVRDIFDLPLSIMQSFHRFAGIDSLVVTHLDAAEVENPIRITSSLTNRLNGKEVQRFFYQDEVDNLDPHSIIFPGWDGELAKEARRPSDLPAAARLFLAFLSETVAPVLMAKNGKELGNFISWWK